MAVITFIVGLLVGGLIGAAIMCLLAAGLKEDK